MIQQSIQQSIQQPIQQPIYDSASQCSGNGVEHSWLGHGVAVAKAFAKSLIPMEDPHFSINPDKALEGIGRLATAIILPTSPILFILKDVADAWLGSCVPGPDVKPELPQTSKATGEEVQEQAPGPQDAPLQQPSAARYQGSQGARGLLALGTLASSFQYVNSDAIADCPQPITMPIKINDTKTLDKIGRDPCYPLNGTYQQTADIVVTQDFQSIGNNTDPFTGQYDGQCRTISDLSDCFVDTLKGSIRHLHFTGANIINSTKVTGVAACVVDINGTVIGVRAENARISTLGDNVYAGIGGGKVRGTVANTTAVNSMVETSGERAYAGIGGGLVQDGGMVANTTAVDSMVKTNKGKFAHAGIGGGKVFGMVANTTAVNSMVKTNNGTNAHAGIGGGVIDRGSVANTTAVNSTVETSGVRAYAGIGGGVVNGGTVANTAVVDSKVETLGVFAYAGIGGGVVEGGTVANTTAVDSMVKTSGVHACVGIGGGLVFRGATVANTTAVNSTVETSGVRVFTGIGGGLVNSGATVDNSMAVNSTVNGQIKNHGNISVHQLSTLCQKADPRVLTANCSSRTDFLDALNFSYSDVCPVNAASASAVASVSTAATAVITTGTLVAASGLGLVGYSIYQWITGYRGGVRGQEPAMKPLTRGKELASAAINSLRGLAEALRHPLTFRQTQQQSAAVAELPTESRATTQAIEIAAPNTTVHDSVYQDVSHLTAKSNPTAPVHGNTYENVSQHNSNSQGIQGTRKRMNRQKVPTEHIIRKIFPKIVTKLDNTIISASKFEKKEAEALQVNKNLLESNRKTQKQAWLPESEIVKLKTNVQESVTGSSDEAYDPLVVAETTCLLAKEEHREATRKETKKARRNHQPPPKIQGDITPKQLDRAKQPSLLYTQSVASNKTDHMDDHAKAVDKMDGNNPSVSSRYAEVHQYDNDANSASGIHQESATEEPQTFGANKPVPLPPPIPPELSAGVQTKKADSVVKDQEGGTDSFSTAIQKAAKAINKTNNPAVEGVKDQKQSRGPEVEKLDSSVANSKERSEGSKEGNIFESIKENIEKIRGYIEPDDDDNWN